MSRRLKERIVSDDILGWVGIALGLIAIIILDKEEPAAQMACGSHVDLRHTVWPSDIWPQEAGLRAVLDFLGSLPDSACVRDVAAFRTTLAASYSGNVVRSSDRPHGINLSLRHFFTAGARASTGPLRSLGPGMSSTHRE